MTRAFAGAGTVPTGTPDARSGTKATAGNDRFHTYVFQQRMGVLIDWWRVLRSDKRDQRFPGPGAGQQPRLLYTGFGRLPGHQPRRDFCFDWCYGDDELLKFVGREGYRDPPATSSIRRCRENIRTRAPAREDPAICLRYLDRCHGLRKFPNPRFDADAWRKVNGGKLGTWDGFARRMADDAGLSDYQARKLGDGSVEPRSWWAWPAAAVTSPLIRPIRLKTRPTPKWENLIGAIGNQYSRLSEIMVSGMSEDSLQWQVFSHTRPGVVDTSAVPTDQVNNPGTINALVNVLQRPRFADELIDRWRPANSCPDGANPAQCWCEPARPASAGRRAERESVFHILKGGRIRSATCSPCSGCTSISVPAGTMLAESPHRPVSAGPAAAQFRADPFDIGQCRRDCPNFRADRRSRAR